MSESHFWAVYFTLGVNLQGDKIVTNDRYARERAGGAAKIVEAAKTMAAAVGIKFESIVWDKGRPIFDRTNHELAITANGKTIVGEFPDEWLADYPGGAGIEKANSVLSEMIRKLRI